MNAKLLKITIAIVFMTAGLAFLYFTYSVPPNTKTSALRSVTNQTPEAPFNVDISIRPTPSVQPMLEKSSKSRQVNLTRKQIFEHLAKSESAADNFEAYVLLADCVMAMDQKQLTRVTRQAELDNRQKALIQSGSVDSAIAANCGDFNGSDLERRLPLLEKAAKAGIPMAAIHLTSQGPWGDPSALTTRGNDPLVVEWKSRMETLIRIAADKGDLMAIFSLSEQYSTGVGVAERIDNELALTYATAFYSLYEFTHGKQSEGALATIDSLRGKLKVEVATKATEAGQRLAQKIRGEK